MIRGSFNYASFLFPFHNANLTENLERVSRRALRYCIELRCLTLCNVVYTESGIGPARFKADLLARKFIFKLFAIRFNILIDKLRNLYFAYMDSSFCSDLYEKSPLYAFRFVKEYKSRIAFFPGFRYFCSLLRLLFLCLMLILLLHMWWSGFLLQYLLSLFFSLFFRIISKADICFSRMNLKLILTRIPTQLIILPIYLYSENIS